MNEVRGAAHTYVQRGWRVFPLHGIVNGSCTCGRDECSSPGKHPLTRHGLYDATTDEAIVTGWLKRWSHANIAIATGAESGLVVIDVDLPAAEPSLQRLNELDRTLSATLTARSGGGGLHLYYRHPGRLLPNTTGRIPGLDEHVAGIDVRAESGYVVAPPSLHVAGKYSWINDNVSPVQLPHWIEEPRRAPLSLVAAGPADYEGDGSAYGRAVLRGELDQLRAAARGTRNHSLNRAAFAIGQVVAGGELDESHARRELLTTALAIGLAEPEARQTLESGFTAGVREPRSAPHRAT